MLEYAKEKAEAMLAILTKRQDMREKFKLTFETPHGQEVLKKICKDCGIGKSAFDPSNPRQTDFRLGQQQVAISILRFMGTDDQLIMEQIRKDAENEQ